MVKNLLGVRLHEYDGVITHLGLSGSLSYSVSILLFAETNHFCYLKCHSHPF